LVASKYITGALSKGGGTLVAENLNKNFVFSGEAPPLEISGIS
jgi:hypothetical protein